MRYLKAHRLLAFLVFPVVLLFLDVFLGDGWESTVVWLHRILKFSVVSLVVYYVSKSLIPGDLQHAWNEALNKNTGSGLLVVARALVILGCLIAFAEHAKAADIGKEPDLNILASETVARWDGKPPSGAKAVNASLVRQESRWNEKAHLHTAREDGFGYGQFTVAYKSDGSVRFDALSDTAKLDPSLRGFSIQTAYDKVMQLRAVAVVNRICFKRMRKSAISDYDAFALCDSAYNSGAGNVEAAKRVCRLKDGCNPGKWADNVEANLVISNIKPAGYGQSLRDINKTHVHNVMEVFRPKYESVLNDYVRL